MDYTVIEVPDLNDSMSRIVLGGKAYHIRFTYNHSKDYWKFGVYTTMDEPIVHGIKIVPNLVLNVFYTAHGLPNGVFGVKTNLDRVGRDDFKNGSAEFIFTPVDLED